MSSTQGIFKYVVCIQMMAFYTAMKSHYSKNCLITKGNTFSKNIQKHKCVCGYVHTCICMCRMRVIFSNGTPSHFLYNS